MRYFNADFDVLDMYQRQIYYWNILFDKKNHIQVLDNLNFSLDVYPEIIKMSEIMHINKIEPGYSSPDASHELGAIIRKFEFERLMSYCPGRRDINEKMTTEAGVGCAAGTTNVTASILAAVKKLKAASFSRSCAKPEIILVLPNYGVYTAQVRQMNDSINPVFVHANRQNGFLATYEEILGSVTENTIAIVITYPNNPAQTTYEGGSSDELRQLIDFCQRTGIFMIFDTIYQDLLFPKGRQFEEPFGLTESLDYVVKVYGPSKDTPFFSGHRIGYWFGDQRLTDEYRFQVSADINTLNTITIGLFGVNLLIKSLLLSQKQLRHEDIEFFKSGMFGWRSQISTEECYNRILEMDLIQKYQNRIHLSNRIQENAIQAVRDFYKNSSKSFDDLCNENIGNVCLLKVSNDVYKGSDDDLFALLIDKIGIGIQPGNVFGVPHDPDNVWFRISLTHDHVANILSGLEKIDKLLSK